MNSALAVSMANQANALAPAARFQWLQALKTIDARIVCLAVGFFAGLACAFAILAFRSWWKGPQQPVAAALGSAQLQLRSQQVSPPTQLKTPLIPTPLSPRVVSAPAGGASSALAAPVFPAAATSSSDRSMPMTATTSTTAATAVAELAAVGASSTSSSAMTAATMSTTASTVPAPVVPRVVLFTDTDLSTTEDLKYEMLRILNSTRSNAGSIGDQFDTVEIVHSMRGTSDQDWIDDTNPQNKIQMKNGTLLADDESKLAAWEGSFFVKLSIPGSSNYVYILSVNLQTEASVAPVSGAVATPADSITTSTTGEAASAAFVSSASVQPAAVIGKSKIDIAVDKLVTECTRQKDNYPLKKSDVPGMPCTFGESVFRGDGTPFLETRVIQYDKLKEELPTWLHTISQNRSSISLKVKFSMGRGDVTDSFSDYMTLELK